MKVFSREKCLSHMDRISPDTAEQRRQITWPFECDGKTEEECNALGYEISPDWMEEKEMEFDKSKILTAVTADQAKVGQKGWFADTLKMLEEKVKSSNPSELIGLLDETRKCRFEREASTLWPLFYPAPEPSYAERQAQWVKENGVVSGTRVTFIKNFGKNEDGSACCKHDTANGLRGTVRFIDKYYLEVYVDGELASWSVPFTALEVIKEPTCRPFNNDELNDLVGEVLTNKQSGRRKLVTGKPTAAEGVNLDGSYITSKDLLASFYLNGDEPCGVREEL